MAERILEKHEGLYRLVISVFTLCAVFASKGEAERTAPFALCFLIFICIGLLLFHTTRYLTLPFLSFTLSVIFCYDSFSVFIRYIWLAPVFAVCLLFHLIRLKPQWKAGATLPPLIAVAAGTLLGGVGMIAPAQYFRPVSLAFLAGLGPGTVFCYWILKNETRGEGDKEALLSDLRWWGMTAALITLRFYVQNVPDLSEPFFYPNSPQWSNNIGTMMMLALPAMMAGARKQWRYYVLSFVMVLALISSGSRGAQLLAGPEFCLCLFWLYRTEKRPVERLFKRLIAFYGVLFGALLLAAMFLGRNSLAFDGTQEVRFKLALRSLENFRQNPLFGSGLGYLGNADLYNGTAGTINWYHVFPAQVIGSMGLFGVLAWGWQLIRRARVSFRLWWEEAFALPLCYAGLLLMSMVNPGEFCPVPYAFLAVFLYVLAENELEKRGQGDFHFPCFKKRKGADLQKGDAISFEGG